MAKVEYEITKDRKSFNILYFPGERARKEMKGDWGIEILELEEGQPLEIEAPREKTIREEPFLNQQPRPQPDSEEEMSPLAKELFERGITKSVAIDLAESFPEDYLQEKIEMHDAKKDTGELATNAAGWLREAITCDFKPSEKQLKKQAQLKEKKAQQQKQRTLEEKAKEIQEQRLKEALAQFPSSEQWVRERVIERVKVREMTRKAVGGEQFSKEEIEAMYLDFSSQIPKTDEEKRAWLISNYREYALSAIIEEFRQEQQQSHKEEPTETANEQVLFNTVEGVLGEVARQMAEFEAKQKKNEKENNLTVPVIPCLGRSVQQHLPNEYLPRFPYHINRKNRPLH